MNRTALMGGTPGRSNARYSAIKARRRIRAGMKNIDAKTRASLLGQRTKLIIAIQRARARPQLARTRVGPPIKMPFMRTVGALRKAQPLPSVRSPPSQQRLLRPRPSFSKTRLLRKRSTLRAQPTLLQR